MLFQLKTHSSVTMCTTCSCKKQDLDCENVHYCYMGNVIGYN